MAADCSSRGVAPQLAVAPGTGLLPGIALNESGIETVIGTSPHGRAIPSPGAGVVHLAVSAGSRRRPVARRQKSYNDLFINGIAKQPWRCSRQITPFIV